MKNKEFLGVIAEKYHRQDIETLSSRELFIVNCLVKWGYLTKYRSDDGTKGYETYYVTITDKVNIKANRNETKKDNLKRKAS